MTVGGPKSSTPRPVALPDAPHPQPASAAAREVAPADSFVQLDRAARAHARHTAQAPRAVGSSAARALAGKPAWYKDAIIYEVSVRSFADSNGDGVGDFRGLMSKLDYLERLGVDTLWLLPIQDSPLRDGGYDIRDYYSTLKEYGSIEEFKELVDAAHARGIRIIMDLVMNHTSDQHPWFQAAKRDKSSPYRDYYVWTNQPDARYEGTRVIFVDTEASNWTFDADAGEHFWHRFFSHQPDLNYDNPAVQDEMLKVVDFWIELGVDGFRADAIPYLFEREGTSNESLPETHAFLKRLRAHIGDDKLLLGEANQPPKDVREYFGDGDELQMNYHFPIMPRLFLALLQESNASVLQTLRDTPEIPENCQWALFLRNHDELTLEMVSEAERAAMYQAYAPEDRMRCNVGIRRRLAPLLGNDPHKLRLMNALLFSLPGTPIVYYGDEIGMGDNIQLVDRDGVRTPMQWSSDQNAGFSAVDDPTRLPLPIVDTEAYGPGAVNVADQEDAPDSLLKAMRHMIAVRRQHPVFGRGKFDVLEQHNQAVLAFRRSDDQDDVVCLHNLSGHPQTVALDLTSSSGQRPVNLLNDRTYERIGDGSYGVTLKPYEAVWLRLNDPAAAAAEFYTRRPLGSDTRFQPG